MQQASASDALFRTSDMLTAYSAFNMLQANKQTELARGNAKNYVPQSAVFELQREGFQWYIKRCCFEKRNRAIPWTPDSSTMA